MSVHDSQRGFIALMSTIVMAAILLSIMASTQFASFYARSDALGIENQRAALALAESCVNIALLALATSSDPEEFDIHESVFAVDTDFRGRPRTCTILNVTHSGVDVEISTYASVDDSFSSVSASATLPPNIQLNSWAEH